VLDGDGLGDIRFAGHDGTDLETQAAVIRASVDGTPGSNDMPGRLQFYTTADGADSSTERMRISSNGQVNIGDNMVVYGNPNLQIRSQDNTAIGAADIWGALNKPGIDVRNSSNTLFSYAGINFFGGTSGNSYAGINMVQTTANSKGALTFWTGGNGAGSPYVFEAMRIDSSQRVLIGHTSSIPIEGGNQNLQLIGTSSNDGLSIVRFNTDFGPYFNFGRAGDANIGTYVAVPNGDELGRIQWAVADGTDMASVGASISAFTEQTAASNDVPSRLVFATTADGASSPTERMRIDSAGRVGIGGIDPSTFSGSANQLVISGSSNTGLTIDATSTTESNIFFADGADGTEAYRGIIRYHHSDDSFRFFTNGGSEAMRIDSSQRVLIGTTGTYGTINANPALQVHGLTYDKAMVGAYRYDNGAGSPAHFTMSKSRGTSVGTQTIVQSGDTIGQINFAGSDGTDFESLGNIAAQVDGTPGANDMPGRIVFSTTSDGSISPAERWRINSYGNLSNGGGDRADLATGFNINQGATLSLFAITHAGGVFSSEVMVQMSANDGYAGRVVRGIWYVRKAAAGSAHSWVELSNTSLGSVNSGVVTVPTITVSTEDAGSNIFKVKVSYSGAGATCLVKATITGIGDSARTLRELN